MADVRKPVCVVDVLDPRPPRPPGRRVHAAGDVIVGEVGMVSSHVVALREAPVRRHHRRRSVTETKAAIDGRE